MCTEGDRGGLGISARGQGRTTESRLEDRGVKRRTDEAMKGIEYLQDR